MVRGCAPRSLLILLLGCASGGEYTLTVTPPDGVEIEIFEVQVLAQTCADGAGDLSSGLDPGTPATRVVRRRREMDGEALGALPLGPVSLYARGFDASCNVVSSSCAEPILGAGGGDIAIALEAIDGPLCGSACDPATCAQPGASCGDGLVGRELCDDLNTNPDDGCDACVRAAGFGCSGEPSVCSPRPLLYTGSTHTHADCIALRGEVVSVVGDPMGTEVCRFTASSPGVDQQCPGGWTQAAEWSTTRGCASEDGNHWPGGITVVCGIPGVDVSDYCPNPACTDYENPYTVAEHEWSNVPVETVTQSRFGNADSGNQKVRWNGSEFESVGYCVWTGGPECEGGSTGTTAYLNVSARRDQVGCQ